MAVPPFKDLRGKMLVIVAAGAVLLLSPSAPLAVDIASHGNRIGHASLRLGFVSVSLVFDSGQKCSKADDCFGRVS